MVHFFSAALSVILTGIHIGMHWDYLFHRFKIKSAPVLKNIFALMFLTAALVFGCYQASTSDFSRWITMPFTFFPSFLALLVNWGSILFAFSILTHWIALFMKHMKPQNQFIDQ